MVKSSDSFSFVQKVLPWIVASGAFLFYAFTLNHWVTLASLAVVSKSSGWDWWTSTLYNPLLYVVHYPFRLLAPDVRPLALNFFAAVCGSLTLALLARSVALLPHDRTREQRRAEPSEFSLLSVPLAWLPPLLAVVVCGLQLSFWEHATSATGEMLDLLIFAYCIRCLLEFRLDERQAWLDKMAFVYGLGITNNWGLIGFFPAFLVAILWIKGRSFFDLRFIVRLLIAGLLGLSLYLLLPLIQLGTDQPLPFWDALRANLGNQKFFLMDLPPLRFRVLLLSLTSILPVLIMGIRWPSTFGETSILGALLTSLMFRVVHALFLIACIWVAFDPKFSPRYFGEAALEGLVHFLTFYYLGALSVGYFSGYFLLVYGAEAKKLWDRPKPMRLFLHRVVIAALVAALPAAALALIAKNHGYIRANNGPALREYAEAQVQEVPASAVVLSDEPFHLYLFDALLHSAQTDKQYILLDTHLLPYDHYRHGIMKRWPDLFPKAMPESVDSPLLGAILHDVSRRKQLFYLHPSFGYYFEHFYLLPRGAVYQMQLYPTNTLAPPLLTDEQVKENESYWTRTVRAMAYMAPLVAQKSPTALFLSRNYSLALNFWGAEMQKMNRLDDAGKSFGAALKLNPENVSARVNSEFNETRRKGLPAARDPVVALTDKFGKHLGWLSVLNADGPFDEPRFCFELGQYFARSDVRLYRQAALEFDRVQALDPQHLTARYWLANMCLIIELPVKALELTAQIRRDQPGLTPAAEGELLRLEALAENAQGHTNQAEKILREASEKLPQDPGIFETLSKIYLFTGRYPAALEAIRRQLQLVPDNTAALRNEGATYIQMGGLATDPAEKIRNYEQAIPPLTRALDLNAADSAALMNRAIAYLQSGKLPEAQRDYEALRKILPNYFPVYYGLAEVAYRQKDARNAIANYQLYLKYAPPNTPEGDQVRKKLEQARAGTFQ